ncbi:hypothetical protein [Cellulomonas humilata]|uniref:Integral membrane protein n=1 Tax=Cellulomonas humilata TaxID=144055 RepID=A0ABU0EIF9_9CELL|nr:hypothetical protein [Cellulomonas humilata]MDQ0375049.1 hypothetical protein [Cellulomonas humilata]
MTGPPTPTTLDRIARALGITAGLVAVAVGVATAVGILQPDTGRTVSLWLVVAVSAVVAWRRASSARLSLLYGIPALTLTGSWWAASTEVWFAYSATGSSATRPGLGATGITVAVLLLLLWALTGTGLLATVRAAGAQVPVRILAVATMVLTLPIWASSLGASQLVLVRTSPAAHGAVRTASLVLVLVVGALVLADRRPPSVWAAAYVLPAAALTWVGWQSHLAVAYGPAPTTSYSAVALPDLVLLPAVMAPLASVLLVALLWLLAVGGTAELGRFRPPPAEIV